MSLWPGPIFTLTEDHLKLLSHLNIRNEDGVPGVDAKRPFGNSDEAGDVHEILGWSLDDRSRNTDDKAYALLAELETALQVVLVTRSFELGAYRQADRYRYNSWVKA